MSRQDGLLVDQPPSSITIQGGPRRASPFEGSSATQHAEWFLQYLATAFAALPKARGASIGLHQWANIAGVAVAAPISRLLLKHLGGSAPFAVALGVQMLTLVVIIASRRVTRSAELEFFDTHDEPGNPSPLQEKR